MSNTLTLLPETWTIVVADLALSSTSPERQSDYGIAHWLWTREVDEKRAVLSLWYYIIYEFIGFLPRSFPSFFLSDRGEWTSQKKSKREGSIVCWPTTTESFPFRPTKRHNTNFSFLFLLDYYFHFYFIHHGFQDYCIRCCYFARCRCRCGTFLLFDWLTKLSNQTSTRSCICPTRRILRYGTDCHETVSQLI